MICAAGDPMPRYIPVDVPVALRASRSDMLAFRWTSGGVEADFAIPSAPAQALRVTFSKPCIVRILDEMPLSTEDDNGPAEGRIGEHFAYRVEGAAFEQSQSWAWKTALAPVSHWQFVTGGACLDVLSPAAPLFSVAPREL